jgi:SPP1 family predicted phage head-tail adaptor
MRSGELRHRAIIQRPVRAVSATGEETVTYQDDFTASVGIKGIRGVMVENARQVAPDSTHKIMMRYMMGRTLNETNRILIGCNQYDVIFVDDIMLKGRWWEIHVKQRMGADGDQSGY